MSRLLKAVLGTSGLVLALWLVGRDSMPTRAPASSLPPLPEQDAELLARRPPLMTDEAAVLLLRPGQHALAGAAALSTAGVPFCVTRDLAQALRRRIVLLPAGGSPRPSPGELEALREFVDKGGLLVLQAPDDPLTPLSGVASSRPGRTRRRLSLRPGADPGFACLDQPEERELRLAGPASAEGPWTWALSPSPGAGAEAVADFPDSGEAAVVRRRLGTGAVYTLGFDLRDLVLRPRAQRHFDAARTLSDGFEPAADVWPLVLRAWYESRAPFWIRLRALPGDARGLLALSHNVGWGTNMDAADAFLALEERRGIRATWFIQTKRREDVLPGPLYGPPVRDFVRRLASAGHEPASHTVAHGPDLHLLPLGGGETVEGYRPALDRRGFSGGTLLGEAAVSRSLLEAEVSTGTVLGFRAAFHRYPDLLDEALAASGYRYDSSLPANAALTHFPFHLLRRRTMDLESSIVELPMTLDDEDVVAPPVSADAVLGLFRKVAAGEGTFVWMLHPGSGGRRKAVLEETLGRLPKDTWVWTLGRTAEFWSARAETRFSFERKGPRGAVLRVEAPAGARDLSFEVDTPVARCASRSKVRCSGRLVVLEEAPQAPAVIELTLAGPG